ncbi:MAG TPA: tRNA (adenosine(37)-N6)-threonylcarbamoyltransferase complex ATPase subunit type 1 TsaE [Lutibacter sp.]|nr:tRNA (adenosine(37)-N6)-threonylcarbamoyltransferase complex ATPase subunit type 1 TsaE [Lutibacter sp.]
MKKELKNLDATKQFAKDFLQDVISDDKDRNVVLLQGNLGTGKTTFSQFLLEKIGAEGPFTSPTFVIMKKYELENSMIFCSDQVATKKEIKNIYHLDCYRVNEESVFDLSWQEMTEDKNNLLLVEWPEKIKKIWPEKYWLLKFEYGDGESSRVVEIIKV